MNNFFTNIPEYNGIGVYALINNRTGKMYIGASKNVYTRIMLLVILAHVLFVGVLMSRFRLFR